MEIQANGYDVMTNANLANLIVQINNTIKTTNWRPIGGIAYVPGTALYIQAMVEY